MVLKTNWKFASFPFFHRDLTEAYAGCAAFAALLELLSVVMVVIYYAYAVLHDGDEIALLLDSWAPTLVTHPVIALAAGFILGIVGIAIRLYIVFGSPVWIIFTVVAGVFTFWVFAMMIMFERVTIQLRSTRVKGN